MERRNRRNLLLALVILLFTLVLIILLKNPAFWFGAEETDNLGGPSPASVANKVAQIPTANNPAPATKKKNEAVAKSPAEPLVAGPSVIAGTRTELAPMEVEVVVGNNHRTFRPGSNSVLIEMPPKSGSSAARVPAFTWSPATNAAETTRISPDQPETLSQPAEMSYPSLARQMKVQGSVLLQALIAADGSIRDLRVLSGNPILTSAALEAARQWRFTPYLQNGRPIETQAKLMVNFTMKVL
jgi:TonB family protein